MLRGRARRLGAARVCARRPPPAARRPRPPPAPRWIRPPRPDGRPSATRHADVRAVRQVDDFMAEQGLAQAWLVSVDTEGHDPLVLEGARWRRATGVEPSAPRRQACRARARNLAASRPLSRGPAAAFSASELPPAASLCLLVSAQPRARRAPREPAAVRGERPRVLVVERCAPVLSRAAPAAARARPARGLGLPMLLGDDHRGARARDARVLAARVRAAHARLLGERRVRARAACPRAHA